MNNFSKLNENLQVLASRAQEGDQQAYRDFLDQLYPYVRAIVRRKLGSIADPDDLTQECLIGIHKNLGTYHSSRPIKPWISAIIRYKVADYFKVLSKRKEQSWDENAIPVTNGELEPNKDMTSDVIELLGSLPKNLKRALQLTHIEGASYSEAAQQEGISEAALRKRISRAYAELRKLVLKQKETGFVY